MKYPLGFLLLLISALLSAGANADDRFAYEAKDPSRVAIFLVTVGRGAPIYMRGGHMVLRVLDRDSGIDDAYNWGIFDFDEPNFALRFFKGNLNYTVSASEFKNLLAWYKNKEHRDVWQHELRLSPQQKTTMLSRIAWWMKPENAHYKYDIREKNCTTIIRDLIAEAVGPQLKTKYDAIRINDTFRNFFREAVSPWPSIYLSLDVLLNGTADKNESAWERMYSPLAFAGLLVDAPAFDDQGEPRLNAKLLGPQQHLYRGPTVAIPQGMNAYLWYALVACLLVAPVWLYALKPQHKMQRLAAITFGLFLIVFGMSSSIYGSIMILAWLFSDRSELTQNANLLLFWPTDFVYCALGYYVLRIQHLAVNLPIIRFFRFTVAGHCVGLVVASAAWLLTLSSQESLSILALTAPLLLATYLGQQYLNGTFVKKTTAKAERRPLSSRKSAA